MTHAFLSSGGVSWRCRNGTDLRNVFLYDMFSQKGIF